MNEDDLLAMLGIAPEDVPEDKPKANKKVKEYHSPEEAKDTALILDGYDRSEGNRLKIFSKHCNSKEVSALDVADFRAAFFQVDPKTVGLCENEAKREFLETLLDTQDWKELHVSTMRNSLAADTAALEVLDKWLEVENENKSNPDKTAEEKELDIIVAVAQAAEQAEKEVEQQKDMIAALGMGTGGEGMQDPLELKRIAEVYKRVKNDPMLRNIINYAGKFTRVARSRQKNKVTHGMDDMIGVVLDGDISRLLPVELLQLTDPDFEIDAMRRIVEKQAMCKQFKGVEPIGKGPIIVCCDESGSMDGDPIERAKGFCLTMAWVARHQKRWILLCGYSGSYQGTYLAMPPGKWDQNKLMDWLVHNFGRGTDMDIPLVELPGKASTYGMPKGKTDLILITDAICEVPPSIRDSFNAWKKQEKVRCISLVLGESADSLSEVSDESHTINHIGTNEVGIQNCLSI